MSKLIAGIIATLIPTLLTTLLAMSALADSTQPANAAEATPLRPLVVFLVRHGEKRDNSKDAQLTTTGRERALALANTLRDAEIQQVHSSDYARTRDTAAPTAQEMGVAVQYYDPRQLPRLVEKLLKTGGRHLVVGHSNSTPDMVKLLTGQSTPEIDEAVEFDRLYIVTRDKAGSSSVLLRYGKP